MPTGKVLQPVLKMKVDELFLCWLSQPTTQLMLKDCLRRIKNEEKTEIGSGDAGDSEPLIFTNKTSKSKQSMLDNLISPLVTPSSPPHLSTALPLGTSTSPRNLSNIRGIRRSTGTRTKGSAIYLDSSAWTGSHRYYMKSESMRIKEISLRQDPDLRKELALLARGCDFVLPSRFKKRLKAFQQVQVQTKKEEPLPPSLSQTIPTFYFPRGCPKEKVNIDAVIAKIERTFSQFPNERARLEDMGKVAKACECPLYWKGPLFYCAGGERTGCVSVHKFVAMWRKILQTCHDDAAKFVHLLMNPGCNYLVQEDFIPFLQDVVNSHPGLSFLKEASEFHSRYITTVIQRIFYTVNRSWSGRITCNELRKSSFLQNVALLEEEADINQLTEYFSYEHFYVIYCKFWELDTDHDLYIDPKDLARHNDHAISNRMIERIFSGAVTSQHICTFSEGMNYSSISLYFLIFYYLSLNLFPEKITLHDLKKCKLANVFFDTFFNIEKYLDHEQKDQFSMLRDGENESQEISDWEKYAAEEYDILVAEEAASDQWNDGYEAELNPVDHQKANVLKFQMEKRPFFEMPSHLADVDLDDYDYEEDFE
ncbi:serine/threonine-protein phosphatase 2A regulatory subunit B'' subunit beta [Trachemys scripta elegans]|uniref:serine/threonine-protein phosphatase 2A regulatory subunit B'' subunit beta n=1 Tax=Trachemys scripta elegans TaxID=31138 RepID=UPI001556297B|nr:serine/threonine-protein phosphatase 2A regulatory subunit B'' subunit beta [Trachemys scripta elegans]